MAKVKQAVEDVFYKWSSRFEGRAYCMYADILGLVTTGIGNLIDISTKTSDPSKAQSLPWKKPNGQLASKQEIADAYHKIHMNMTAAKKGAGYACGLTDLRLSESAVKALVMGKMDGFATYLTNTFPEFPTFPADAQLALLGFVWAVGSISASGWPKFHAAIKAKDWATCAEQSKIREDNNPGVKPRNEEQRKLFLAAAAGGDPNKLSIDYSNLQLAKAIGTPAPEGEGLPPDDDTPPSDKTASTTPDDGAPDIDKGGGLFKWIAGALAMAGGIYAYARKRR